MIEPIHNALRVLRESVAGEQASDALEKKLVAAFREQHRKRSVWLSRWAWASAVVAASVLLAMVWRLNGPAPVQAPVRPMTQPLALQPPEPRSLDTQSQLGAENSDVSTVGTAVQPKRRKARQPVVRVAKKPNLQEQEFIEIPYAPAFEAMDGGQVVRVNMRGASVRRLGLPVITDRVQADVLLGEDGIARAIRLVSNSGLNSTR
jgi:hypothetical protein